MSSLHNLQNKIKKEAQLIWTRLPDNFKSTWQIRAFALLKIPMVAFLGPQVLFSSDQKMILKIPMGYRSKNHLNSMYFGALAVGADLVVGLLAKTQIEKSNSKIQLVFKDFKAEYLKRAEADVHFICDQGEEIKALVEKAENSEERVNQTFKAYATVPDKFGDEPVARFELTLSLKKKVKKS